MDVPSGRPKGRPRNVKANPAKGVAAVVAELSNPRQGNQAVTRADHLVTLRRMVEHGGLETLEMLLPLALQLSGQPYTLNDHFPFSPMYKTNMPKRLLLKTGRQTSKCLSLSMSHKVRLSNGQQVAAAALQVGSRVLAMADNFRFCEAEITNIWKTGRKPVFRVRTRLGAEFEITADHRLRTFEGYLPLRDLTVGTRLAGVRCGGVFNNIKVPRARLVLTAYLIGDGCCGKSLNFAVTSGCQEVIREATRLAQPFQTDTVRVEHRKNGVRQINFSQAGTLLVNWLKSDGLWDKYSHEKFIPAWVYDLSLADTRLFLSRLWATDGMQKAYRRQASISYSSTSPALACGVRNLLNKLGIPASIKQRKAGYRRKDGTYVRCRDAYIVSIETRDGWYEFARQLRIPGKPHPRIPRVSRSNNNRDTIPLGVRALIAEASELVHCRKSNALMSAGLRYKPKYALTYGKLGSYIRHFQKVAPGTRSLQILEDLADGDVTWDEIVEITAAGVVETVDIEVADYHNFVLDGVVSHNSTNIAARSVMLSSCLSNFRSLHLTPLYEQIRRFSNNYVKPFIDLSPLRSLWKGTMTDNSVLQRTFKNGSMMQFSFCLLDCDRVRGVSADCVWVDEAQDFDPAHIPIIQECLSYSAYGMMVLAGTPKSLDNPMEGSWLKSSQAEWFIPCYTPGCNSWNIPAREYHLDTMLGPSHDFISEKTPGIVCHKCRKPINPRPPHGRWVHRYPARRFQFAGYHVPQIILPLHYGRQDKWSEILAKREGYGNMSTSRFYNEVMGESVDVGQKLVTETDLKKASKLPWKNTPNSPSPEVTKRVPHYKRRVLAVDWGGGGAEEVSFTTLALLGMTPDNKIHCLWGKRLVLSTDHLKEAKECWHWLRAFRCDLLAHDYTGAGIVRETVLAQAGFDLHGVMPVQYVRAASKSLCYRVPATVLHNRDHFRVDKTRSLLYTCQAIKLGILNFFEYDRVDSDTPGLIGDFLSLVEEKVETRLAGEIYTITRNTTMSDDFAQAVNIGCVALWHSCGWPDFAAAARVGRVTRGQLEAAGSRDYGWENDRGGFYDQP